MENGQKEFINALLKVILIASDKQQDLLLALAISDGGTVVPEKDILKYIASLSNFIISTTNLIWCVQLNYGESQKEISEDAENRTYNN